MNMGSKVTLRMRGFSARGEGGGVEGEMGVALGLVSVGGEERYC